MKNPGGSHERGLGFSSEPPEPHTRVAGAAPDPGDAQNPAAGTIYSRLAKHQRTEPWFGHHTVVLLQEWANVFTVEFKLDIGDVSLRVDRLPVSRLGHYRTGHNGFGLKGEIALNTGYLSRLSKWEVLGVLLHELLHAWQDAHGTPGTSNHHNWEFRHKALSLGLIVDARGVTGFSDTSAFKDLLRHRGVEVPEGEIPPRQRAKGMSKLKKWSCSCGVNVRCARPDFYAQCLECGQVFKLAEASQ